MIQPLLWCLVLVLAGKFETISGQLDAIEICQNEEMSLSCDTNEVIVVHSAEYGRKEVRRCITKADQYIGCTNNVINLVDRWCSGSTKCELNPTEWGDELESTNTDCLDFLKMYLRIEYSCMIVMKPARSCTAPNVQTIRDPSGTLSSQVADETGCGSTRSPWKIEVKPGQTIDITLIDFSGSSSQGNSFISCKHTFGYILERSLGINHTICGGGERESVIYSSKTNMIEINMLTRQHNNYKFVLQYTAVGCQDPVRPSQTAFRREGTNVIITCEKNDKEWHLTCTGTTWKGVVGNCSEPVEALATVHKEAAPLPVPSLIIVACIIGGAVVVTVAAIMCGVIHLKKYRMKQERKRMKMQMDYATIGRPSCGNYGPASKEEPLISLEKQAQNTLVGTIRREKEPIWKMPLPEPLLDPPSNGVDPCACVTLPGRGSNVANNGDNMDFGDAGNYQNSSVKYSSLGK